LFDDSDEEGDKTIDNQEEEDVVETGEVKKRKPRFLTREKCDPGVVLMHCPWCPWVKPIPAQYSPAQYESEKGSGFCDYYTRMPTSEFKKSNCYKKTMKHLWDCGSKRGKDRSFWGPFFARTYGKKNLEDKLPAGTTLLPRTQNRSGVKKRYMTASKCKPIDTILRCNMCDMVKRWPEEKLGMLKEMKLEKKKKGYPKVVCLSNKPSVEMRQEPVWKKMRAHVKTHNVLERTLYTIPEKK
jgi:hypothetical protein